MDFPGEWLRRGVNPDKLSPEVIETDRWDREDRERMLKEVKPFAAARKKLAEFAKTGEPALNDMFAVFLKAEPEPLDDEKIKPTSMLNKRIIEAAQDLDVTERLRRYTVNDDVQSALSCETIEPDMETLFDMTDQQQKRAEEFERKLRELAKAEQDQIDLDDMFRRWTQQEGLEECPVCGGAGEVPERPDQNDEEGDEGEGANAGDEGQEGQGDGDGQGQGEGEGAEGEGGQGAGQGSGQGSADTPGDAPGPGGGQSTVPCPNCHGTGQQQSSDGQQPGHGDPTDGTQNNPGGTGRGTHLTDQQRKQMEEWARQQKELADKTEQARKEAEEAGQSLEEALDGQKAQMRAHISKMLTKAADEAQAANETALTWGLEPGELQRLPAEERMELAKRLNNERFRRVAQLFGPMKNMMLSEQARKTVHTPEEVYDVTLGNNIGRLLPQEILNLRHGPTRLDFMRRFTEGRLLEYDMQGVEKLAKGAIIFCEDGSGSMSGEREMWAKAVMLCLLHLSRIQKRAMHVIHFSSRGQFTHIAFEKPADYSLDRILDAAELFYGGGTDFETPMKVALDLLNSEFGATGKVKADVFAITAIVTVTGLFIWSLARWTQAKYRHGWV
jgi:uncharacterized protein with von Willebrand factor type A (vWA) domain